MRYPPLKARKKLPESQRRPGNRGAKDGEGQCEFKFRYLPNSGYVMP